MHPLLKPLQKQTIKYWIIAAKALMLLLLFLAIYWQLFYNAKGNAISNAFNKQFAAKQIGYLLLAFVLVAFNFVCETQKWLLLTKLFYKLPFLRAYKAIFAGSTMAFFTPNRIGEYGGRVLFVPKKHIFETVAVTMVGGLAQQIITLLFGLVSLFILKDALLEKTLFTETQFRLISFINILLCVATLVIFFNVGFAIKIIAKINWLKKFAKKLKVLQQYQASNLINVLLWALVKYLVFSLQFYWLIMAFGVPFKFEFIWLSMLSFLLQTLIPSISLFELGVRGNVVLFTFGAFTHLKIEILTASVTLWIMNLLIPAIIGAFFILKIKVD